MRNVLTGAGVLALLLAGSVWLSGGASAADAKKAEEPKSIKEIMGKLHKGTDALHVAIGKQLKGETDWGTVQAGTKVYADLATGLAKFEPKLGDKESFKTLAKHYADDAKVLNEASQKKDKETAAEAFKKLSSDCMACHKDHRPKPTPKPKG